MALKLQDLIDIVQFQMLQDRLNEIYAFPSAIIDNDGVVLTATAWQEICTKFHRQNAESLRECIKSDRYIADHLREANPCVSYRCPHGLIDNATPIIIDGVHYGNFFTGQFFLEPPDIDFFRAQAKRYGFAEEAYLAAVRKVPIWSQQQRDSYLFFIKGLIEVISGIGLKNLRESEIREQFRESEERFRAILRTAMDGFLLLDLQGRILESNATYQRMSGYSERQLLAMQVADLEAVEQAEQTAAHFEKIVAAGADRFETRHRHKEGHLFDVEVSAQYRPVRAGQLVAFVRDIGERRRAEEEKARSQKAAERLAEEMAMIAEIGRVVGSTLDIDKVYERVAAEVRKLIPCDRFLICRKQPQENKFTIAYAVGMDNPGRRVGDVYPSQGTAFGLAIAKQAGVLIQPETAEEIRDLENLYNTFKTGLRSTLIIPLISLGEVIGSMNIRSRKLKAYGERDMRLAERIGIQVAGAIANAQLFTELRENRRATERLAEEMATIAEIGRVVGSTLDIDKVYERVAAEVRKLLPCDRFMICLCRTQTSDGEFVVTYTAGADNPGRRHGDRFSGRGTASGEAMATRAGVLVQPDDAEEIRDRYPNLYETFTMGIRSTLVIPLISMDEVIGTLNIRSGRRKAYTEQDVRLAERIGMQVAGAIVNAQLFTELRENRRATERLAQEMATIAEIGRVIGSTPDIEQVYDRFAAVTRQLIPFDTLSVNLFDASQSLFRIAYFSGADIPGRTSGLEIPTAGSMTGYVLNQRKAMIMRASSAAAIARRYPGVTQITSIHAGFLSNMLVPLMANDVMIGVLHFRARQRNAYGDADLSLADRIGMQVAGAIANAQLFAELQEQRKAAERLAGEQAAVAEIGRVIGSTPDIEQVYDRFAAITQELIPFETLSVNLLDASRDRIRIAYFSGSDVPGRRKGCEIPIVGSMTSYALKERKALIMRASSAAEIARRYPEITQSASIGAGYLSSMLIPLLANDTMIGILHFRARRKAAYDEQDLRLAERVGMQIAGAVANAQLFDDLRQTEKALRESEERFRLAYATSPDAININRLNDGLYVDVNEGFTRLTGYSREDVIGRTTLEINIWCDPTGRRKLVGGLQERGYVENLEAEFRRKDGSTAVALMSAKILVLQGVPHVLSITRDISDRKHAEEEKARLQEQLLQSQKMESIGRLAGGVAHDFNNMLGVILGHLEMAMDEVGPGHRLFNDLREIGKAAQRSADLTRQLLAFARKQTIAPKALALNETVEEALKMLRRLMGEDIQLAWLPAPGLWPVRMDPSQVDQILANLCVNARDAIDGLDGAGKVTIETRNVTFDAAYCADHREALPGDYVCLAVSDNGSGMDRPTLDKLFEPFFTTKAFGKGTGLGLATIYGIIKQNNGFITVDSEPGQGTTFRTYLPRHTGPAEGVPEAVAAREAAPAPQGRETILVVEDEPDLLDLTRLMLERQGYRVITAGTPGEAIRLAEEQSGGIELLVTDVVMPEMNGRALAERILALHPRIKCLFTSGYTADVIAHHGILDTGTAFIQKPFSRDALAAKVREVLDRV